MDMPATRRGADAQMARQALARRLAVELAQEHLAPLIESGGRTAVHKSAMRGMAAALAERIDDASSLSAMDGRANQFSAVLREAYRLALRRRRRDDTPVSADGVLEAALELDAAYGAWVDGVSGS